MGGLFGSSTPKVQTVTAPTVDNSAAKLDAAAEAARQAALRGRSSTILTGGTGLKDTGTTTSTSKLLGGM